MYPTQALSRVVAAQPVLDAIERDHGAPRATFEHLTIGQSLTGQDKSLARGVAVVEIAGQTVAMRLPHTAQSGDTLRLRFAGHMPQAVFLLEAPETAAAGDTPQLSPTARLLSDLVQRLPERNAPPTLTPPLPLFERPGAAPAEMALALRTALVRSGLFYESHLADWAVGLDSLDGLMQEPQNRRAAAQQEPQHRSAAAETARAASPQAALPEPGANGEQKPLSPMLALLSQQLQVLESPQFAWRGELWPGQSLSWSLRQESEPDSKHGNTGTPRVDDSTRRWESRLDLTLPRLGKLTVHITLDARDARQAFSIRITPERPAVETLLQDNQARLLSQMSAAGCALQAFAVQHDADA